MLFIDQRRYARSLAPKHAPAPFLQERFRNDRSLVDSFFQSNGKDPGFLAALREELQRCRSWVPSAQSYPTAMLAAAQQAVTAGQIDVASALPDDFVLRFDVQRPSEWDRRTTLTFVDPHMAERFVVAALRTKTGPAAFEAALQHPDSRRYPTTAIQAGRQGPDNRSAGPNPALVARLSPLLADRLLGVRPRDTARQIWWLVWMEHARPTVVDSPAPAPPPQNAAAPPPDTPPPAASTLADAPDDVSPQAQALIDAAQDGVPFCEECARRAAAAAAATQDA